VDGKLRRRSKAQLSINNDGLQVNRLLRPLAFDFGQRLKERQRRDLLFALPDEFGKSFVKTFFAHRSILLLLPPRHPFLPQIESDDDETLALEHKFSGKNKLVLIR
jgi:hypothetical protein